MRKSFILLFVLFSMVLMGCNTTPQLPPETKYVAVLPDDNLLVDCDIETPPSKSVYLANYGTNFGTSETAKLLNELANMREREAMLIRMNDRQIKNIQVCNARFKQLRFWKVQAKDKINTQKKE